MLPPLPARRRRLRARLIVTAALLAVAAAPSAALAADDRPPFVIAVLGDSYASGEGAPDVHGKHSLLGDLGAFECLIPDSCFAETWWSPDSWFTDRKAVFPQQDDVGWQAATRRCHRSSKAPGPQAAMRLADQFPDVRIEVLDFACGGAEIGPGLLQGWAGPEPDFGDPALPSQLAALRGYLAGTNRRIDATVVNIGGNDGEFASLVAECLNLINPFDDCTNNATLTRIREELTPDDDSPQFPDEDAPMSERYEAMNNAIEASGNAVARPDELYLTALPNPTHDALPGSPGNPQDYCDGTQTSDPIYDNATRAESVAIEGILAGLNRAMQNASDRHGWKFMPEMFEAWRDHGICAGGASFLRTNAEALKLQGDEGLAFVPHISPGIAHPNENGHADRARSIADVLEEHIRMRFRAPVLSLQAVEADRAFRVSWSDPSPAHLAETRWELRLSGPGFLKSLSSDTLPDGAGFSGTTFSGFRWRVPQTGEFQARVRGCRAARNAAKSYCGPYSAPVTVATAVPATPLQLHRVPLTAFDGVVGTGLPIRLAWNAAPATPASATYQVQYGKPALCVPALGPDNCISVGGIVGATGTSVRVGVPTAGAWLFRVRACSTAGCSPYSPFLGESVSTHGGG